MSTDIALVYGERACKGPLMLTKNYKVLVGSKSIHVNIFNSGAENQIMEKLVSCVNKDPSFFSPIQHLIHHKYIGFRLEGGCSIVFYRQSARLPFNTIRDWPQCRWNLSDLVSDGDSTVLKDTKGNEIILDIKKPVYEMLSRLTQHGC